MLENGIDALESSGGYHSASVYIDTGSFLYLMFILIIRSSFAFEVV